MIQPILRQGPRPAPPTSQKEVAHGSQPLSRRQALLPIVLYTVVALIIFLYLYGVIPSSP